MKDTRRLLLVALAGLCLAACGTPAAPPVAISPPPVVPPLAPLPDSWSRHIDVLGRYSIGLPDAWDVASRSSPTLNADLATIGQHSPQLQAYFKKSLNADPQLRFIGADSRSLVKGFATNASVYSANLGPVGPAPTLAEMVSAKLTRLQAEPGINGRVAQVPTAVRGYPAMRLDYTLTVGDVTADIRSFIVVVDRDGNRTEMTLTMGSIPGPAAYLFDTIAGSWSIN